MVKSFRCNGDTSSTEPVEAVGPDALHGHLSILIKEKCKGRHEVSNAGVSVGRVQLK